MILTTKTRYAVMAVVDLAINGKSSPISLEVIANRQKIALNYLEQIFFKLKKSYLVKSVRGPKGGYILNIDSHQLTIDLIIQAVEESIKMTRCEGNFKNCNNENIKCLTHDLWVGLSTKIQQYFQNITVADICDKNLSLD